MPKHNIQVELEDGHFATPIKAFKDPATGHHFACGDTVPSDGTAGYAKGCIFVHTDGSGQSDLIYHNVGSASSADFDALIGTGFIPVALHSLRETTNFDVGNATANGGVLASDTTPVMEAINAATDGCQRVNWAAGNSDQVVFQVPLPPDLDTGSAVEVHVRAAMAGATDTPDITVDSFFNEGDTKVTDTLSAITGTSYAEYTASIAAADVPAGAQTLTCGLTPGTHANDALYLTAVWIEYDRAVA